MKLIETLAYTQQYRYKVRVLLYEQRLVNLANFHFMAKMDLKCTVSGHTQMPGNRQRCRSDLYAL
jgi:hypothetical protein